jgi:hypothetical protein
MPKQKEINIEKMSDKNLNKLSYQIGKQISDITEKASEDINNILKSYGLSAKIQIAFEEKK